MYAYMNKKRPHLVQSQNGFTLIYSNLWNLPHFKILEFILWGIALYLIFLIDACIYTSKQARRQLLPVIWTCSGRQRAQWWTQSAGPPPQSPPWPATSLTALPGAQRRWDCPWGPSCRWWTRCSPIWSNPRSVGAAVRLEWPWLSRRMRGAWSLEQQ